MIIVMSDRVQICHKERCAPSLADCSLSDFKRKEGKCRKWPHLHKVHITCKNYSVNVLEENHQEVMLRGAWVA